MIKFKDMVPLAIVKWTFKYYSYKLLWWRTSLNQKELYNGDYRRFVYHQLIVEGYIRRMEFIAEAKRKEEEKRLLAMENKTTFSIEEINKALDNLNTKEDNDDEPFNKVDGYSALYNHVDVPTANGGGTPTSP